jgi:hypothetical protein
LLRKLRVLPSVASFLSAQVEKAFPFELSASGFPDGCFDAGPE